MTNPQPDVVAKLNAIAEKKRAHAMRDVEALRDQAAELTRLRAEVRRAETAYRKGYNNLHRTGFFNTADLRAAGLPAPEKTPNASGGGEREKKLSDGDERMRS
jgi:hypothetical protein